MPTYNNALTDQPANRLAYPGGLAKRGGSLDSFVPLDYSRLAAGQFRQDTPQMREYAANVPVDVMRGRLAGMLGFPSDVLNMFRTPSPMEMFGQTDYEQPTQVPYGSEQFLKTLPLAPAENNPLGRVANRAGSLVPFTPMEALQAARMARQAAMATGKFVAPKAAQLTEGYMQRMGMMPSIVPVEGAGVASAANVVGPEVASANQLAAFTRPKAEVSPLGFYSAVEQQALNIPRKSGTGASFINDLMKGQDVKKYEIEAMGLDEFLKGKPNVTRQEVQDFIAGNRIDVQERQLGGAITEDPVGIAKRKEIFDKYELQMQAMTDEYSKFNKALDDQTMAARDKFVNAHAKLNEQGYMPTAKDYEAYNLADAELKRVRLLPRKMGEFQQKINNLKDIRDAEANAAYVVPKVPSTKYDRFQLPGGENYREILLTLPTRGKNELDAAQITAGDLRRQTADLMDKWKSASELNPSDPSVVALYQKVADSRRLRDQAETTAQELKNQIGSQTYQSSHFNEPNVLAHMRVNDRIDADGKKMLLIEEVQSDWHQAGREKGYQKPNLQTKDIEVKFIKSTVPEGHDPKNYPGTYEAFNKNTGEFIGRHSGDLTPEQALRDALYVANNLKTGVPNAPFKDTWHQLALKRAIKEAVDKGYDRIGLTTGKQQIDRFSDQLRQNVDEINFNPIGTQNEISVNAKKNGQNTFSGTIKDGKFIDGSAAGKTVEEVLGKTMAKQIAEKKDGVIKGDDLTIGGEGMKKYYDEIYPAFLEKQGKKYGAKMGETQINSGKVQSKDELAAQVYGQGMTYRNLPSEQKRKIDEMGFGKGEQSIRYLDITPAMRDAVKKGQPLASMQNELANRLA